MKASHIISLIVLMLSVSVIRAQEKLTIIKSDGTRIDFDKSEVDYHGVENGQLKVRLRHHLNNIDSVTLSRIEEAEQPPFVADVEPIDLGLSVKWAPFNIDATAPEEFGGYYQHGALTYPEKYDETGWCSAASEYNSTGLNPNEILIPYDISGTRFDVATQKWGGLWRIPTWKEWQELYEQCTWDWTKLNGVNGMNVTGPNGNSIFLPAAGYIDDGPYNDGPRGLYRAGEFGNYKTSNSEREIFGGGYSGGACSFYFKEGFRECTTYDMRNFMSAKWYGRSVRPVYGIYSDPGIFNDERGGLMNLYESTSGNGNGFEWNWKHWDNWDTETMLGTWYGVTTDKNGHVIGIDLEDNDLNGFSLNYYYGNWWVIGSYLPYVKHVNINNNPNTGYKGIHITGVKIQDLVLDNVGLNAYIHGPAVLEGVTNVTIQNCTSQFYGIKGDFDNLIVRNIHAEPWDWRWFDDSDMPFVLQEGTAKKILVEDCNLETDVIATCDELTIKNTKVEHYSYSSQQIDEGTTKPSKWKTQVSKRFECVNSVLIVKDLDFDDFAEGCNMVFENVTLHLKDGTILSDFSANFINSQANWRQYMRQ